MRASPAVASLVPTALFVLACSSEAFPEQAAAQDAAVTDSVQDATTDDPWLDDPKPETKQFNVDVKIRGVGRQVSVQGLDCTETCSGQFPPRRRSSSTHRRGIRPPGQRIARRRGATGETHYRRVTSRGITTWRFSRDDTGQGAMGNRLRLPVSARNPER